MLKTLVIDTERNKSLGKPKSRSGIIHSFMLMHVETNRFTAKSNCSDINEAEERKTKSQNVGLNPKYQFNALHISIKAVLYVIFCTFYLTVANILQLEIISTHIQYKMIYATPSGTPFVQQFSCFYPVAVSDIAQ